MKDENPLVTVIIPSYNHSKYIEESIESIINQDYSNIELLIIDDGSNDDSIEIIKNLIQKCSKRFTRFDFIARENKGLCATLNEALNWSKGKYFSPFASDDIALIHKTSFLVNKLENSNYPAAFGRITEIGKTKKTNKQLARSELIHTFQDLIRHKNIPAAPAAMIKTSVLKNLGGYSSNIKIEDWYMWLKITNAGYNMISYPNLLAYYRRHDNNTVKNTWLMHFNRRKIIQEYSNNIEYNEYLKIINMVFFREAHKNIETLDNNSFKEYNRLKNKITNQTKEFSDKNIVLYGSGTISELVKKTLSKNLIIFDRNPNKDNNQYPPEKILDFNFDKILITAIGYEDEITNTYLKNITPDKIWRFDFL